MTGSIDVGRHRRLPRIVLFLLAAFLLFAWPHKAHALACSATVTDLDFGTPSLLSTATTDALGTLTVTCTGIPVLTAVKMCPSFRDGSGGSDGSARLMSGPGAATLSYQLYQDSSRTQAWGSVDNPEVGTVPALTLNGSLSGAATTTRTIYGRMFGSQFGAPPGSYDSAFTGAEAMFTYSLYFLAASGSCTGFVGTAVIHPEFDVVANPTANCTVIAADLAFPAAGVLNSAIKAQADLRVTCTARTPYSISLDNGRTGTSPVIRKMSSAAGATVSYGLYRDSARLLPWGTSANGLGTAAIGTGASQSFTVYGLVPVQATPAPGSYADRVVVTVTY